MTSYSMDVEMFISEVKKFPEIWNNNSEDNRFRSRRLQAWTEIARILIDDFDEMTSVEKSEVYKKLQNKWRNIRDSYVRHKRRNYAKKGYLYAKHLSFLEDLTKNSQSGSDIEAVQNECDDTWPSDADDETKLKKMLYKSTFEAKEEPLIEWPNGDETPLKRKRSLSQPQIEFETSFPEATVTYNEDEDRSFFLSLLPAVRDFSIDQKLEFRSDLLRLIKQYRKNGRAFRLIEDSD